MLKRIRYRKLRIPNAVAIAAALLLLISALADAQRPSSPTATTSSLAASQGQVVTQPATMPEQTSHARTKQAHKFRVHLFMFRH